MHVHWRDSPQYGGLKTHETSSPPCRRYTGQWIGPSTLAYGAVSCGHTLVHGGATGWGALGPLHVPIPCARHKLQSRPVSIHHS